MKCLSRVGSIPDWSFVKCPLKIQFEEAVQPWRESKPFWTWLFLNIHFRKTRTDSESDTCVFCYARTRRGQKHVRSPWKKKCSPGFDFHPVIPFLEQHEFFFFLTQIIADCYRGEKTVTHSPSSSSPFSSHMGTLNIEYFPHPLPASVFPCKPNQPFTRTCPLPDPHGEVCAS